MILRVPIIAGGSFFYTEALLHPNSLPQVPPNPRLRTTLEEKTAAELFAELKVADPARAETIDPANKRRLVRALEIIDAIDNVPTPADSASPYKVLTIGIDLPKETLHHNIKIRLEQRLEQGMIEEVQTLLANDVTPKRLEDLGLEYRYISRYLHSELDYATMVTELNTKIKQFAKRQLTWLKRDSSIIWYQPAGTQSEESRGIIFDHIHQFIHKLDKT